MIDGLDNVLGNSGQPGLTELHAALGEVIGELAPTAHVIAQQRLGWRVYRLRVDADGSVRSLVLKLMEPSVAQRTQLVVERWLPTLGLSEAGPHLLGVAAMRNGEWVWHVYDDLGGRTLAASAADRRGVEAAVEVIARLHTRSVEHPLLPQARVYGRDLGMHFYTTSVRDAIRSLGALQPSAVELSPERLALRDRLLAQLRHCLDEQAYRAHVMAEFGGPEVLLHGDLWPENMLVYPTEEGPHVRLIDWDGAGVGPISYDLSTLLSRFPSCDRLWILDVYRGLLGRLGWHLPSIADLNLLFATAEWARWANGVIEPALAAAEGAEWGFDDLALLDQWCELMLPVLPHEETAESPG